MTIFCLLNYHLQISWLNVNSITDHLYLKLDTKSYIVHKYYYSYYTFMLNLKLNKISILSEFYKCYITIA